MFFYRTIDTTPAIYGLIWVTPTFLADILARKGKFLKKRAISELFPLLIEDQQVPVKFHYEVTVRILQLAVVLYDLVSLSSFQEIKKKANGKIEVQSADGRKSTFDFLIWSGLPSDLERLSATGAEQVSVITILILM